MTIDFNDTLRLEVEASSAPNLLAVSTNSAQPDSVYSTITNPSFATVTTGWTPGTGWTLTRLVGPPTSGQLTKAASVTAGQLIATNTQNIAAAAGEFWNVSINTVRVSTSPASVDMQLRLNLVAYNASNVRLGVVTGYNGTTATSPDATLFYTDLNGVPFAWTGVYSAVTPAGTSYLRFELLSHNAWTYVATAFSFNISNLQIFRVATRTTTGWTATNSVVRKDPDGGWDVPRTGEASPAFESDKVAVTVGKPMAVAADILDMHWASTTPFNITAYNTQVGIRYYNSSNGLISESLAAPAPGAVVVHGQDRFGNPLDDAQFVRLGHTGTPPAGTATASLVVKSVNGVFGDELGVRWAVLIQAATTDVISDTTYAGALPASTSNRIINPSGQLGAVGWTDYGSASVLTTRDQLPANVNAYDFRLGGPWDAEAPEHSEIIVAQSVAGFNALYSNTTAVTAGQWIGGKVLAKGRGTTAINSFIIVGWEFRNSADAIISTVVSTNVFTSNDTYKMIKAPVMQAPAGTVRARMVIQNSSANDGSFAAQKQYAWMMIKQAQMNVGATDVSVTGQPLAYAEHWKDILGPTHEIGISRSELDTGVLTAEVLDPALDPAQTSALAPGLKVRLRSLVNGAWTTSFYGTITALSTSYDVDGNGVLKPRVHLEAADPIAILANTSSAATVATVDGLANNMPSSILWTINGKSSQGTNPTIVGVNQSATVLDQVAITRDTNGGFAWMDRTGVFNVWDAGVFDFYTNKIWFTDAVRPTKTGRNENLLLNPSFNTNITGWSVTGGTSTWNSTTKSAVITATGGTGCNFRHTSIGVVAGQTIGAVVNVSVTVGKAFTTQIDFYDDADAYIGTVYGAMNSSQSTGTVPAGATKCFLFIVLYNDTAGTVPAAGTVLTVNAATLVVNASADWAYEQITGDDDYSYWTGAVNNSSSVKDYGIYQDYLTNIDIGFNTNEVINDVTIKRLEKNATSGQFEEIAYGPYLDTVSIAKWGSHKLEVTIANNGVSPATRAAAILAQNSTPVLAVKSVTFRVNDAQSFALAATIDLYNQVHVRLAGKVDAAFRVAGITHSIRADIKNGLPDYFWECTLEFKALGTAAVMTGSAPQPPAQPAQLDVIRTVRKTVGQALVNSATMIADDDLKMFVEANTAYVVEVMILATVNANSSGSDIKFAWSVPSGALNWTGNGPDIALPVSTASGPGQWLGIQGGVGLPIAYGLYNGPSTGVAGTTGITLMGTYVSSDTPGTLTLMWAQNIAVAGVSTSVTAGSYMRLTKL